MTRIPLIATAILFSLTTAAEAATVTGERVRVEEDDGTVYHKLGVNYEAGVGEANDLTVTITGEDVTFEDAGAAIDAQGACTNTDSNSVVCSSGEGRSLSIPLILLGDGDDQVRIVADSHRIGRTLGGAGDDQLYGSDLDDGLAGGPGDDRLYGGVGFDGLAAGRGNDLVDGGPGGDTIDGGGGRDELLAGELGNDFGTDAIEDGDGDRSADDDVIVGNPDRTIVIYRVRRRPLMIDLAAGTAGARGERDELTGITSVIAGRGDDHLVGSRAGEFIVGNRGADEIRALGGDDRLRGEGGADRLFGGRGDDIVDDSSTDDTVDKHNCGPGYDFVAPTDKRDRLRRSCEDGGWSSLADASGDDLSRITTQPAFSGGDAVFRSTCRQSPKCSGRIVLKAAGSRLVLGRGSFEFRRFRGNNLARAPRHDVVAHLSDRGRAWLADGGFVRVVIVSPYDCMGCLNPPPPARMGFTTWMKR